jgi:hypothetical protein
MWICSQHGFYSIVADTENPGNLLLRARDREHLKALLPHANDPDIRYTPDHDYPYRVSVSKFCAQRLAEEMIRDIDYPNFKSRADYNARWGGMDSWYAEALHRVWSVMYAAAQRRR